MTDLAPIELRITLGPSGFRVILPSGRVLNVSASEAGARFIEQMLRDAEAHRRYGIQQKGHIAGFPTQEIARIWERQEANRLRLAAQAREYIEERQAEQAEARKRRAAAKKEQSARVWAKKGIDVSKIKVNL